ncbi:phosphoribosylanthranilate isomerase [Lachnospiraceae bacterium KM106-2]|nr:phosphoribosylanthranilate isomerase [Lachnospiraceae bacterium KM106-2]
MTRIKICGITTKEDVSLLNRYHPDYAGFVFAPSRRQITSIEAMQFRELLDHKIKTVGVFVRNPIEEIKKLCEEGIIDLIQLHGGEDENYIRNLKDCVGDKIPIIYAVKVEAESVMTKQESHMADFILYDTYSKRQEGGSGITFNWKAIQMVKEPYFLAGGLNNHNVLEAIHQLHPYAIDVSSGVETNGRKDPYKIEQIIRQVRKGE